MSKSYKELIEERQALDKEIKNALVTEKPAAIAAVLETIKTFNLTAEECGFKLPVKKKASKAVDKTDGRSSPKQPKYRNPKNPDETWTGLGATSRRPIWVRDYLDAGGTLDELLINPK